MSNPWLKKNPLMSMWLSAANSAAGSARGRMTAQARRAGTSAASSASSEWIKLWTTPPKPARSTPTTRVKKRR
ncbi:hypothetical protein [Variovorax sp. Sphag1AA]|uniref:hypothetical protein n=1 Tax=Variovorax sp. Sphag1AA TaxID=2587027 RepID=UPI0016075F3A|nr:hypothetical protein [Variovorax sp. Sphag1AA]MBB3178813.1 hypothetical protein [Variovorax sp. Sphag1AA]